MFSVFFFYSGNEIIPSQSFSCTYLLFLLLFSIRSCLVIVIETILENCYERTKKEF